MATLIDTLEKSFGTYYSFQLRVYYSSQNVSTNKTAVYFTARLTNKNGSGWISTSAARDWSGKINGSSAGSGTYSLNISSGTEAVNLFTSNTVNVTHNSDGTKTITVSCTFAVNATISSKEYSTITVSGSITLPTIPRASSISSAGNVTVNGSNKSTVNISAKSSAFNHKVKWSIGDYSHTESLDAGTTSVSYAIPVSWLNAIPNAESDSLTITLTTYSGSTKVGDSATKTIKISVPDENGYKPTFTAALADGTTTYSKIGAYIKGKSKFKVSLSDVAGKYSATIKEIQIVMNGTTYKPAAGSSASATSGTLSTAGENKITVKVTDSRGYSTSKSLTAEVLTYSNPSFSKLTISRYRMDTGENAEPVYVKDDEGPYANVEYTAKITSVGSNAIEQIEIKYTPVMAGAASETVSLTDSTGSVYVEADTELVYNFEISITDKLSTVKYTKQLSTAATIMDILKGGLAVAFGKVAELAGYLDIAWNVIFRKQVYMNNYSDEEKNFHFQNDASRQGKTYENDGVYPHTCKLYGGNGASRTGIGLYDLRNSRSIWAYDDVNNYIVTDTTLYYKTVTVTINSTNATEVAYSARAYYFLRIVVFHARFTVNEITRGVTTELGTISSSYAPVTCLAALSTWVNSSLGTVNCASHITTGGSICFHFRDETDSSVNLASGRYVYVAGVWTY